MRIIRDPRCLARALAQQKKRGLRIGFVPTMGALHAGHRSLIRRARQENDCVVVSIFVNPLQFAPHEDLKKYPRSPRQDICLCRESGVNFVFVPVPPALYRPDFSTAVTVKGLSDVLCGRSRPGHFEGVATVVAKLFHIVSPDVAYFGQKDAQQALIIGRMARDLDFGVRIKVLPIVREADGLAMSSRNAYLDSPQRKQAAVLYQSLKAARSLIVKQRVYRPAVIIGRMRSVIRRSSGARIDYIAIVSADDLTPVRKIRGKCLIAVAAWFGTTRLIDNIVVTSSV